MAPAIIGGVERSPPSPMMLMITPRLSLAHHAQIKPRQPDIAIDLEIPAARQAALVDIVERSAGNGASIVDTNIDVRNVWNTRSRAAASARSAASVRTVTPVSLAIAAPSFSRRSAERATRQTLTPSRANHCATASPIPFELAGDQRGRPVSFKSSFPPRLLRHCHAEFCGPCPSPPCRSSKFSRRTSRLQIVRSGR